MRRLRRHRPREATLRLLPRGWAIDFASFTRRNGTACAQLKAGYKETIATVSRMQHLALAEATAQARAATAELATERAKRMELENAKGEVEDARVAERSRALEAELSEVKAQRDALSSENVELRRRVELLTAERVEALEASRRAQSESTGQAEYAEYRARQRCEKEFEERREHEEYARSRARGTSRGG